MKDNDGDDEYSTFETVIDTILIILRYYHFQSQRPHLEYRSASEFACKVVRADFVQAWLLGSIERRPVQPLVG
jgi:hypothetical protein